MVVLQQQQALKQATLVTIVQFSTIVQYHMPTIRHKLQYSQSIITNRIKNQTCYSWDRGTERSVKSITQATLINTCFSSVQK